MKKIVLSIVIAIVCGFSIAQIQSGPYASAAVAGYGIIGLDPALGGYIFYLTPDGKHGLVAAAQDQSSSSDWYLAPDVISNPANYNTDGQKFTDWRLPTKYELNLMYNQKNSIGGFSNSYYWNSIENGSTSAWLQNFGNGIQDYGSKERTNNVRAVRSF